MTAPNHVVGGLVFTGIFAAFTDVNILEKPEYIAITVLASLIPDIDHTKSTVGKIVFPLAKIINQRYGHRTITHTLLALFLTTLAVGLIEKGFNLDENYSKLWLFGFLSHLIFDMMTVQGVPLFYPFAKNPCVLPANPETRFRTGNLRTETMIFSFFLLSGIFCQPLLENGFWLQFNRSFGTLAHLNSQFKKTENLLSVDYTYRIGSETVKGSGLVTEANETKATILTNDRFLVLEKQTAIVIYPFLTDSTLRFETISFVNIEVDSLERMMKRNNIKYCEIFANKKFELINNNISSFTTSYKKNYPQRVNFALIKDDVQVQKIYKNNPQISSLQTRISQIKEAERRETADWERHLKRLKTVENALSNESDLSEKTRLFNELKELERKKETETKSIRIEELENELATLIKENSNNEIDFKEANKAEKQVNTTFTGQITKIIIQ
jgi:inner membrane protein